MLFPAAFSLSEIRFTRGMPSLLSSVVSASPLTTAPMEFIAMNAPTPPLPSRVVSTSRTSSASAIALAVRRGTSGPTIRTLSFAAAYTPTYGFPLKSSRLSRKPPLLLGEGYLDAAILELDRTELDALRRLLDPPGPQGPVHLRVDPHVLRLRLRMAHDEFADRLDRLAGPLRPCR